MLRKEDHGYDLIALEKSNFLFITRQESLEAGIQTIGHIFRASSKGRKLLWGYILHSIESFDQE